MRIGINATSFGTAPSGARQRLIGLYGALIDMREDDEFIIYEPVDTPVSTWFGDRRIIIRTTPLRSGERLQRWLAGLRYWPRQLEADRIEHLEHLHLPIVRNRNVATQTTIHDIRSMEGTGLRGLPGRVLGRMMVRRDDAVVTVSDSMASALHRRFPGLTVRRIYNGISLDEWPAIPGVERDEMKLLAVGHLEPRKNFRRLIQAIAVLHGRGQRYSLTIVGADAGEGDGLRMLISDRQLESHVMLLTDVGHKDMADLYRQSGQLVFPSVYEGFGIPLLEAMATETPMTISDIPVFREIAGDAGTYFDPLDPYDIANSIELLAASQAERQRKVRTGSAEVRKFAYQSLAADLSRAIDSIHGVRR